MTKEPDADLPQALLGRLGVLDVRAEVNSEGPIYLNTYSKSMMIPEMLKGVAAAFLFQCHIEVTYLNVYKARSDDGASTVDLPRVRPPLLVEERLCKKNKTHS